MQITTIGLDIAQWTSLRVGWRCAILSVGTTRVSTR
jgi:hypothetical protein